MNRICMYTPSAGGGHARYTRELLTALAQQGGRRCAFELVTSEDLEAEYRSDRYAVHAILPALHPRSEYANAGAWAISRLTHYARRERRFLSWLKSRPDVSGVHFQEWTPWLAGTSIRRIRAMGKQVFYTLNGRVDVDNGGAMQIGVEKFNIGINERTPQ